MDLKKKSNFPRNIKNKIHLPPINSSVSEQDRWEIKCLPSDWKPQKKPSIILQNYLKRKQKQHEDAIEWMKWQKQTINDQLDDMMREGAAMLNADFKKIQKEIDLKVEENKVNEKLDMIFQNNKFDVSITAVRHLHSVRKKKLKRFFRFLHELEMSRSKVYKTIFRELYLKLHKIGYMSIYELDKYFEGEIIQINEVILLSQRHFMNVLHQLALKYENDIRNSSLLIQVNKDKWCSIIKEQVINIFNEDRLKQVPEKGELLIDKEHAEKVYKKFAIEDDRLNLLWKNFDPVYVRTKDLKAFSKAVDDTINKLDSCALGLVKMYKVAVMSVFNGYFDSVRLITQNFLQFGLSDSQDVEMIETEYCLPIVENITKHYDMELSDLNNLWKNVITELQTKLKKTFSFLLNSASLWDNHFARIENAKKCVLQDLYQTINNNDKIAQRAEMKLNIHLDTLRQGTEENIDQPLEIIFTMLDNLLQMYYSHFDSEISVITKYKELSDLASAVVIAELKQFLNANPRDTSTSPVKIKYLYERNVSMSPIQDIRSELIPKQVKMCQYHIDAVQNWMCGLWEAIENCVNTTTTDMKEQCEDWVKSLTTKISKRLEVKLAIHQPRYATIKEDCYELRKSRLQVLKRRMERHSAGLDKYFEDSNVIVVDLEDECKSILDKYSSTVNNSICKVRLSKNAIALQNYKNEFNTTTSKYYEQLDNTTNTCKGKIDEIAIKTKEGQIAFFKNIEMFYELGNVYYSEGLTLMDKIKSFDKNINKQMSTAYENINVLKQRYNQLFNVKKEYFNEILTAALAEFQFNETVIAMIKDLHATIRRDVFDLRFNIKKGYAYFKDVKVQGTNNLGNYLFINTFDTLCAETMTVLYNIRDSLSFPEKILENWKRTLREQSMESTIYEQSNSNFKKAIEKTYLKRQSKQNFSELIFETPPTNDGMFIGKTYTAIYESFNKIKDYAEKFYSSHKEVINECHIQATFENFIGEVLGKYSLYQMQVNSCWLDQVRGKKEFVDVTVLLCDYKKLVTNFQDFLEKFIPAFVKRYKHTTIENMTKNVDSLKKAIIATREQLRDEFKKLHYRLRSICGHPLNHLKLKETDEKIQEFLKKCPEVINCTADPFKKSVVAEHTEFMKQMPIFQEKLIQISRKIIEEDFFATIKEEAIKIISVMLKLRNRNTVSTSTDNKNTNEANATIRSLVVKLQIPSECFITLKASGLPSLSNVSCSPSDISSHINLYTQSMEDIDDIYQIKIKDVLDIEGLILMDFEKWKKTWQSDVKCVLALYTVKYE